MCGDAPSLGSSDPSHGVQLFATTRSYPMWESPVVTLPKGQPVKYRYAIFSGGSFKRFEDIKYDRFLDADDLQEATAAAAVSTDGGEVQAEGHHGEGDAAAATTSDVLDETPPYPPPVGYSTKNSAALTGQFLSQVSARFEVALRTGVSPAKFFSPSDSGCLLPAARRPSLEIGPRSLAERL